jgi:catechol 2,3-dioxygenase-like lactoylglutathione lyase family enzyme
MKLLLLRVNHVQITIPPGAENDARKFYCDILGLREVLKPELLQARGGFWLEIGELQIHVGIESGVERNKSKAHLAYEVNDLENWRNRLQGNGAKILESIPIPNYNRFEFRDPFGNRVEFLQKV